MRKNDFIINRIYEPDEEKMIQALKLVLSLGKKSKESK